MTNLFPFTPTSLFKNLYTIYNNYFVHNFCYPWRITTNLFSLYIPNTMAHCSVTLHYVFGCLTLSRTHLRVENRTRVQNFYGPLTCNSTRLLWRKFLQPRTTNALYQHAGVFPASVHWAMCRSLCEVSLWVSQKLEVVEARETLTLWFTFSEKDLHCEVSSMGL